MSLSIIIPVLNEEKTLFQLFKRISAVCNLNKIKFEIIFIDDGSNDNSWNIIKGICIQNKYVKAIKFSKNFGKSIALYIGIKKSRYNHICTIDSDLQDYPEEIPKMYDFFLKIDADLVSGWKYIRRDSFFRKKLPSYFFNKIIRYISKIDIHDFNCGLKIYKKKSIQGVILYGDMHRYIPFIIKSRGYNKIYEKKVIHTKRKYGVSKYGPSRYIRGFLDLLIIFFMNNFYNRTMHVFGFLGMIMFFLGFTCSLYLGTQKIIYSYFLKNNVRLVTDSPYFYISLVFMILGTQLFLTGFISEIIIRSSKNKVLYDIDTKINI